MILGLSVVKVEETDVAVPSGPVAAIVKVYAVEGCSSSVVAQVPSGSTCPGTAVPLASTRVTAPKVPDEAFTVTGALGRTSAARSAGVTASTAGVVSGVGVVVGELCCAFDFGLPLAEPTERPWQAVSRTLSATRAAAQPWARWNLNDTDTTSTDSHIMASGRWFHRTPVRPATEEDAHA